MIVVGSSTSTASRSTSTALLSTIRTARRGHERVFLYPMQFAKKMRVFPHLINRHLFLAREEKVVFVLVHVLKENGTRTRKPLTSISHDLWFIVAMMIAVGSSTSTASRSTSTALLSTIRTARRGRERVFLYPMLFAKQKLRAFTHLIPRILPLGWEWELRIVGTPL